VFTGRTAVSRGNPTFLLHAAGRSTRTCAQRLTTKAPLLVSCPYTGFRVTKAGGAWSKVRFYRATPIGRRDSEAAKEAEVVAIKENSVGAAPPQAATASATSGAEETAEGTKDVLIEETETVTGQAETLPFQSETSKLLRIVAHSLYTDKEVFVRELISNASDASEKLRHLDITGKEFDDKYLPLEIHISTDDKNKTITIQDFGIGMTKEELVKNLGTIAHSGTQEYLRKLDDKDASGIIGQFGVGFYSAFMVGNKVRVYSRSAFPGSKGYCWTSEGTGAYSIAEADGVSRGTKIIVQLLEGQEQFAKKQTIEGVIKKYSNFVGFPIKLNGVRVNTVRPLWTLPKQSISEEDHKQFYQFLAHSYDLPIYRLHFTSDAPFSIQSLFYVPEQHQEKYGMGRMEPGVSLFSRKVLVKPKMKSLLPDWLRFIKGVVDCEDVSLHLSREHFQDSDMIKRLGNVMTGRIIKLFQDEAAADPAKYNSKFWKEFSPFIKEGICTDAKWKDELGGLLRCETSSAGEGQLTSLDSYVKRMKDEQNSIYYLCVPSRNFAESSPYYEGFKQRGVEVLFLYTSLDEFVMQNLGEYAGKRLQSIESAPVPTELTRPAEPTSTSADSTVEASLDPQEVEDLAKWIKSALLDRVSSVKETKRLVSSPAIIVDHESASFRRMMKFVDPSHAPKLPKQRLEINPAHPIIARLNILRRREPAFAKVVAEQVFDNALIAAGLMDDPRGMLSRLNSILEVAARPSQEEHAPTQHEGPATRSENRQQQQ